MKYLSNYTEAETTKALNKAGAFFAFSDRQFNEQKKEGVKYTSCGMGMICPRENVDQLIKDLDEAINNGIKQDIAENGIDAIITRELHNHEAGYTGSTTATEEALSGYPITHEQVVNTFKSDSFKLSLTY